MAMALTLVALVSGCSSDDGPGTGDDQQEETSCPAGTSSGVSCSGSESCSIGEESCCFETHPASVCQCTNGRWSCIATDACAAVSVQGYCACRTECEDPAPGAPNYECEDGSTGGPVCEQTGTESCEWTIRVCPEEM
jgi:hypothetical protein